MDEILKKDEAHAGAVQGITLLEEREKNKLFAVRIGAARLLCDHGWLLAGIIVSVLILIWFYNLHVNVRDIQISNSPGGGFYTIFENRVEDISRQNDQLKNDIKKMQNVFLSSQKTQKDQIFLKLAENSARFQKSEKKFLKQISQLEEKLEKSIHHISLLADGQAQKVKRDVEQGLRITQVQKNMDKIFKGLDGLTQDLTSGITKQQEIDNDLKAVAADISALKEQGDDLGKVIAAFTASNRTAQSKWRKKITAMG